jgi:predicted RNase H-like nuclease (RuvC/YqgF family)
MRNSNEMSFPYPQQQRDSVIIPPEVEPRFSVNSNLMNYSIPKNNNEATPNKKVPVLDKKREIQRGDSDTRTRQLEAQIEQLTLQNVKLQRTNRLLKVDTDNLIEQKTSPLEKTIQELTIANVKLQRASRLLQQELDEKSHQLNTYKQNQILQMKSVGPEYEFLVQNINLLQRQVSIDKKRRYLFTDCFGRLLAILLVKILAVLQCNLSINLQWS